MSQKKKNKKKKNKNNTIVKSAKICPICEKPHKMRTQCCSKCNSELIHIQDVIKPKRRHKKVSINKVMSIKNKYKTLEVFDLIRKNPQIWYSDLVTREERLRQKREVRAYQRSEEYRNQNYQKWESETPMYIHELMKLHPSKKLLTLSGDKLNPNIHYLCMRCNEEQMQTYESLRMYEGHNCTGSKSSGEIIVEEYLKSFTQIKTQRDTFKCINPITNKQLPYDIEIVDKKLLIEIQGNQHLEYIEYFHGTIENFYYQQRKDSYKKRFAEHKGYKLIYIYYDEIKDGSFKDKLKKYV